MQINISAQHTQLTPALEEAVHEKLQRLAEHSSKPLNAHVNLLVENGMHVVEAVVNGTGKALVAKAQTSDMYASINEVAKMLDRQYRKQKTSRIASRQKARSLKRMGIA